MYTVSAIDPKSLSISNPNLVFYHLAAADYGGSQLWLGPGGGRLMVDFGYFSSPLW